MNDNIASFLGGAFLSIVGHANYLMKVSWYLRVNGHAHELAMEWSIKIIGTLILGVIGGVAGLLAKDIYAGIKRRFKKK
jgi:CDP-diglyceride synthetase